MSKIKKLREKARDELLLAMADCITDCATAIRQMWPHSQIEFADRVQYLKDAMENFRKTLDTP